MREPVDTVRTGARDEECPSKAKVDSVEKITLPVDQITPGMRLAEPITNANGIALMPSGIRLTPMFIARIKKWNIKTLEVIVEEGGGKQAPADVTVSPTEEDAAEAEEDSGFSAEQEEFARSVAGEVAKRFVNVKNNPLMVQLRAVVIRRLVLHGPDGIVNILRRAPGGRPPLPGEGVS